MNDLSELERLRDDVPAPSPEVLQAVRSRLVDRAAQDDERPVRPPAVLPRPRRRRRALIGFAAAVVAVAIGTGVLVSVSRHDVGTGSRHSTAAGRPGTWQAPTYPPLQATDAASVLEASASRTLLTGDPELGAGQYLYTRDHLLTVTQVDQPPGHGAYEFSEGLVEQWMPAALSGTTYRHSTDNISVRYPSAAQRRYAVSSPAGVPQRDSEWDAVVGSADPVTIYPPPDLPPTIGCLTADDVFHTQCPPPGVSPWEGTTRGSLAQLPVDTAALRASLFAWARRADRELTGYGKPGGVNNLALAQIGVVLDTNLASAPLRAALYRVARTIPGITLTGRVTNYDGVTGLGISLVGPYAVQHTLIFDLDGGGYIGQKVTATEPSQQYHLAAGTVLTWSAVSRHVAGRPPLPAGAIQIG